MANYAKYKDWVRLNDIFNSLIAGYKDDIEKYAKKNKEQDILRYILNYGWGLAGQRFQFAKFAGSSYKSSEMGDAFRILEKTLLLELVYHLISTSFPIVHFCNRRTVEWRHSRTSGGARIVGGICYIWY